MGVAVSVIAVGVPVAVPPRGFTTNHGAAGLTPTVKGMVPPLELKEIDWEAGSAPPV